MCVLNIKMKHVLTLLLNRIEMKLWELALPSFKSQYGFERFLNLIAILKWRTIQTE